MANVFDQFDTPRHLRTQPAPAPAATPAPVPPASATAPNVFDQFDKPRSARVAPPPPGGIDWSRYNQPAGELRAAELSPSERAVSAAQDALIAAGADPYRARHLAEGVAGVAQLNPAVAAVRGAADLPHHLSGGNWGGVAGDVLSAVPGVVGGMRVLRGSPQIPMAETPLGARPPRSAFAPRDVNQVSLLPERGRPDPYGLGSYGVVGPQPRGAPTDELWQAGQAAYRRTAANPTQYHPQSQRDLIYRTIQELAAPGAHGTPHIPENSPEFYALMQRWFDRGLNRTAPITTAEWDAFRQELRSLPAGASGTAGAKTIDRLDRYMWQPPPGAVVAGAQSDLDALRRDLDTARGNWRAYRTAQSLENELANRTSSAIVANQDPGGAARATLNYFANTGAGQRRIWGATADERAAIRTAAESAPALTQWFADKLGSPAAATLSTGGGAALAHSMGLDPVAAFAAGTAAAGIPKAASVPLRAIVNNQATQAAEDVIAGIRRNSPLYAERATPATGTTLPSTGGYLPPTGEAPITDPRSQLRDAITYALMPQVGQQAESTYEQEKVPYANRLRVTPLPEGESYAP